MTEKMLKKMRMRFILGKKGISLIVLSIKLFSMAPPPIFLTLKNKKQLTHDVYELEYTSEENIALLPGQFLLCDTSGDPKFRRSYSVSWASEKQIFFIIKRLPE